MFMFSSRLSKILLVALLTSFVGPKTTLGSQEEEVSTKSFTQAKTMIESNCGDCVGATKEGLQEGIEKLQEAIVLGYKDQVEAYRLLAEAYNTLTLVHPAPDSTAQKKLMEKKKAIYEQLLKLAPDDVEISLLYADFAESTEEKMATYRKVLQVNPKDANTMFLLGRLLIQQGHLEEGVDDAKKAILLEHNIFEINNYMRRVVEVMEQRGCKVEFREKKQLARLENDAEAIETYKQDLVKLLAQAVCEKGKQ